MIDNPCLLLLWILAQRSALPCIRVIISVCVCARVCGDSLWLQHDIGASCHISPVLIHGVVVVYFSVLNPPIADSKFQGVFYDFKVILKV